MKGKTSELIGRALDWAVCVAEGNSPINDGRSRFDLETRRVDAGVYSSSATIYESKEVYDKAVSLRLLWQKFYLEIEGRYRAPIKGITEDAINQAAKLLGLWG